MKKSLLILGLLFLVKFLSAQFTEQTSVILPALQNGSLDWGDYNNDSYPDMLITGYDGTILLSAIYLNNTDGTFTEQTSVSLQGVSAGTAKWGDFDNDGDLDILLVGYDGAAYQSLVYENIGTGFNLRTDIVLQGVQGDAQWGDFDNDGKLDIILAGSSSIGYITKIYKNTGTGFTEQTGISLPGVSDCSIALGDFDNDEDLDILLTGYSTGSVGLTKIFENLSGDFIERSDISLPNLNAGSAAWGDMDSDGDLDFVVSGQDDASVRQSYIYENTGTGFSQRADIVLTGIRLGETVWGDFDTDGDLDLLLTGDASTGPYTTIYENVGTGFTELSGPTFEPLSFSAAAWGDYDMDGDLDFMVSGDNGGLYFNKLYRNDAALSNSPPVSPNSLASTINGNSVELLWSNASDAQTSATGLSYNVRIGSSPGASDIMSGSALTGGQRALWNIGNVGTNTKWSIKGLAAGTYYWSVQSVDNNFAGSSWSTESSFTLTGTYADYLKASYVFNGDATDVSGHGYNGTVSSASLTTDKDGVANAAYNFFSSYPAEILISNSLDLLGGQTNATFLAWVQPNASGFFKSIVSGSNQFEVAMNDNGTLYFQLKLGGVSYAYNSTTVLPLNKWSFISCVYDGAFLKLYIDGNLDASANASGIIDNVAGNVRIGNNDNAYGFDGDIDELRIYTTALSDLDITNIYEAEKPEVILYSESSAFNSIPGFQYGDLAWGDADNDGDLDLIVTGQSDWGVKTYLVYNDAGSFTRLDSTSFAQTSYSDVRWLDYDKDGDMDVWLDGVNGSIYTGALYRNDGAGSFTNLNLAIQGMYNASPDWGDYDADGDLDLLLVGKTVSGSQAFIYRNNAGIFEERQPGFMSLEYAAAKFGDYDADGDLDVLISGKDGAYNPQTVLYQNNGDYTWTDVTATQFVEGVVAVDNGDLAWLDFDADGLLDFVLTGRNSGGTGELDFYRRGAQFYAQQVDLGLRYSSQDFGDYDNDGDLDMIATGYSNDGVYASVLYKRDAGSFTKSSEVFYGVNYGTAKFGDYDGDGDLDIAIMGANGTTRSLKLYVNSSAQANFPPAAPSNLTSVANGSSVNFSWDAPSDDYTPSISLGYNLKVGTSPGAQDVLAPTPNYFPALGNVNIGVNHVLNNLPDGDYYWSVQAVDNGFRTGSWSLEQSFTLGTVVVNTQDSLALVALYNATNGASWTNQSNWLSGPVSTWFGVTVTGDRVTRLNLVGNNLDGSIPIEIGNLSALTYLDLGANNLPNAIPSQLGNMLSLDTLYMANSQITGSIPTTIGNLTNLKKLALDANQLSGTIPIEIGLLTNLTEIYLQSNLLSGAIPSEMGNMIALRNLYLNSNQLSGSIPISLGSLTNLQNLVLYQNQLTGNIPAELGYLTGLYYLDLDYNQLSGSIPWQLGNLVNLQQLFLDNNLLTGSIPIEFGDLTNLFYLYLNNNQLSGTVPLELNQLVNLYNLDLSNNQFDQLNNLSALTNLEQLYIQNNQFDFGDLAGAAVAWDSIPYHSYNPQAKIPILKDSTGTGIINLSFTINGVNNSIAWYRGDVLMSGEINNLLTVPDTTNGAFYSQIMDNNFPELTLYTVVQELGDGGITNGILDAEYNALIALFNSTIGGSWVNSTNWTSAAPVDQWYGVSTTGIHVTDINLYNNNLAGTIPVEIGDFPQLGSLNLSLNQIGGTIPTQVGNLSNLYSLSFSRNQLTGNIPVEMGKLTNLTGLYLYSNQLTGSIPTEIGSLTLLYILYIYDNPLTGSIPSSLENLTNLTSLDMSDCQLSGNVPIELGSLSNLTEMYLNNNLLTGSLPSQLGNLTNLVNLYLQNNQFTGSVPLEIGQLANLYSCNLTDNMFSSIPQFSSSLLYTFEYNGLQTAQNYLSFESLEPNAANLQFATKYAPQKDIPLIKTDSIPVVGNYLELNMNELAGRNLSGVNNSYLWYKDGVSTGVTSEIYTISSYSLADSGYYYLEITNSVLPDLVLKTKAIHLTDQITLTIPNAPSNLTASTVSSSIINLFWTDNSDNENKFNIYYSNDGGTTYNLYNWAGANQTSAEINGLSPSTTYSFMVSAVNGAGESSNSNVASATTQAGTTTAPVAPSGLSVTPTGASSVDLSWTDNSDNEDYFYIYNSTDGATFSYVDQVSANITSYTNTGLMANTTYYFKVCAYNTYGETCSSVISATTLDSNVPTTQNEEACFGSSIPNLNATGTDIKWYGDASLSSVLYYGNSFPTGQTQVGTYTYYVTQTVSTIESGAAIASLTIRALPDVDAGADIEACDMNVQLNANSPVSGNGAWSIVQGSGYFDNVNNNSSVYNSYNSSATTLSWTITDNFGCTNIDDIIITFKEKPFAPNIHLKGGFIFICTDPDMQAYQWYKDGNKITGANEQFFVEREGYGTNYGVEITATNGCSSYSQMNYKSALAKSGSIRIYPMPASQYAGIDITNESIGNIQIRITDQAGVLYKVLNVEKSNKEFSYSMDVSDLNTGFYIVEFVFDNHAVEYKKLVKE